MRAHSYLGLLRMSQLDSFYNLLIRRQKCPTGWPISREFFLAHHGVPPGYYPAPNLSKAHIQAFWGCAYAVIYFSLEQQGYEHKYKACKWKHNLRIYMVIVVKCRRNILWPSLISCPRFPAEFFPSLYPLSGFGSNWPARRCMGAYQRCISYVKQ